MGQIAPMECEMGWFIDEVNYGNASQLNPITDTMFANKEQSSVLICYLFFSMGFHVMFNSPELSLSHTTIGNDVFKAYGDNHCLFGKMRFSCIAGWSLVAVSLFLLPC